MDNRIAEFTYLFLKGFFPFSFFFFSLKFYPINQRPKSQAKWTVFVFQGLDKS